MKKKKKEAGVNLDHVVVNMVELASELADARLRETFKGKIDKRDAHGDGVYTEAAQDEFNDLYDYYWDMIYTYSEKETLKITKLMI